MVRPQVLLDFSVGGDPSRDAQSLGETPGLQEARHGRPNTDDLF